MRRAKGNTGSSAKANGTSGFSTNEVAVTFDTCLKYENDQISFDFDNPGEAPPEKTAAAEETTALEETEESERKTISNHEN